MFGEFISYIVNRLPIVAQFAIGDFIGWLWFDVFRIRRDIVLDNLLLAFPNLTEAERVMIGRASLRNTGRGLIEFLRIPAYDETFYHDHFVFIGDEHIINAREKNRGVCILTLHLGCGDWATVGLQTRGFPLHIISKEFKWKPLNDFWFKTRMQLGTTFISDRGSSLQILKALKRNALVVFMLDQFMGPPIGVKTTFFGHETGTAMGLAVIAGRAKSPVVPVFSYRLADGRTAIEALPEIPFVESENSDDTVRHMTQVFCNVIEQIVRKHPGQWMWVHRRWKKFKF